jgi:hypothetical protein
MICNVNAHGNQTVSVVTLSGGKLEKKDSHADTGNHSNVVINVCAASCKVLFFFVLNGNSLALAGDTPFYFFFLTIFTAPILGDLALP